MAALMKADPFRKTLGFCILLGKVLTEDTRRNIFHVTVFPEVIIRKHAARGALRLVESRCARFHFTRRLSVSCYRGTFFRRTMQLPFWLLGI